jgi:hypothetical protein
LANFLLTNFVFPDEEKWNNFPKEALDKLYESMPCHVAALKEA